MFRSRQWLPHVLLVCLVLLSSAAFAADSMAPRSFAPVQQGPTVQAEESLPYAADRLIVQFKTTNLDKSALGISLELGTKVPDARTGIASIDALAAAHGVTSIERPYYQLKNASKAASLGQDRWYMFRFDTFANMADVADAFRADPTVSAVSLDWRAYPAAVPNDPTYDKQWGHDNTGQMLSYDWATFSHENGSPVGTVGFDAHAPEAWDQSQGYGSLAVVIAILDSGVDIDHPDLNLVTGYDFGDNDTNPDDNSASPGHGTACAGVAAADADNGIGVAGVAGNCSIMPLKVANSAGSMFFSAIQNALYYAADNGAHVASMSFSADISNDAATDAALLYAYNAGVVLMAATSNDNQSHTHYPANYSKVMGIGAASPCGDRKRSSSNTGELNPGVEADPNGYTCDGERWWGSNYGSTTQDGADAVDLIAPTIMPTTDIGGSGGYDPSDYSMWFNGTSCATPYAAGCAALVISANPTFTPAEVREALISTTTDVVNVESGVGWDRYSGYGMVNVDAALGGSTPVAPTAAFTGTPTSGDVALTVNFSDQSAGAPTSWSWTFGDGGTSTQQSPSYTYNTAGVYTVSLTAINAVGSDTSTQVDYITVTEPVVVAAFSGTPTSGTFPLNVSFTDESTGGATSWSWTFGDGGTSSLQNPFYTYNAVGTYTVSLTAASTGSNDTNTKVGYITVTEPGVTTFVTAEGETSVIGTVSGTYVATKASDGVNEIISEETYTGHPRKQYSYAEHIWNFTLPGGDTTFHLEASRTDNAEGDNFLFEYSTDGVNYSALATVSSATEQSFTVPLGTLTGAVTVRATDTDRTWENLVNDDLSVDYIAFEVADVQPVAPTADFVGTPVSGEYPLAVSFSDLSTGAPTVWSWTFGDGGTATTQNPSHTYTVAGSYNVSLTATNAQGSDTATKTGYITVTEPGTGTTTMHVGAMAVTRAKSGPNYFGSCDVTVVDGDGLPVGGATVTVSYDGATSGTTSGTTAADGTVTLLSSGLKKPIGEWCFDVTNITHASLSYDAASNVTTRSCESGDINSANDRKIVVTEFSLGQNSPNPFNPMTEIKFNLPRSSNVMLKIYNVRGQVVTTLANGSMGAGQHAVTWDARQHPSGVYFYRLVTPDFSETKKMIMLK